MGKVRIQVRVPADNDKREVPCTVVTGFIGAVFVSSLCLQSK